MKIIRLTNSPLKVLCDDEDYHLVKNYNWYALKSGNTYHAETKYCGEVILMHWLILPLPHGLEPDHRDRNGLNNQKSNLRASTHRQNCYNYSTKKRSYSTSKYFGVSYHRVTKKWRVVIRIDGKSTCIGRFKSEKAAARAYDAAALKRDPVFNRLNFPKTSPS